MLCEKRRNDSIFQNLWGHPTWECDHYKREQDVVHTKIFVNKEHAVKPSHVKENNSLLRALRHACFLSPSLASVYTLLTSQSCNSLFLGLILNEHARWYFSASSGWPFSRSLLKISLKQYDTLNKTISTRSSLLATQTELNEMFHDASDWLILSRLRILASVSVYYPSLVPLFFWECMRAQTLPKNVLYIGNFLLSTCDF